MSVDRDCLMILVDELNNFGEIVRDSGDSRLIASWIEHMHRMVARLNLVTRVPNGESGSGDHYPEPVH